MIRKIKNLKWSDKAFDGKKLIDKEIDTIEVLNMFLMNIPPEKSPNGIANFRLMQNIAKAFDNCREKERDYFIFEQEEYSFFRNLLEKYIPAKMGTNKNLVNAINEFLNPEEISTDEL